MAGIWVKSLISFLTCVFTLQKLKFYDTLLKNARMLFFICGENLIFLCTECAWFHLIYQRTRPTSNDLICTNIGFRSDKTIWEAELVSGWLCCVEPSITLHWTSASGSIASETRSIEIWNTLYSRAGVRTYSVLKLSRNWIVRSHVLWFAASRLCQWQKPKERILYMSVLLIQRKAHRGVEMECAAQRTHLSREMSGNPNY